MVLKDLKNMAAAALPAEGTAAESRRLVKAARKLLEVQPDWAGGEQDQARLTALVDDLQTALASVDGRLVMGLLGGTGVGKSTLISALAGQPISKASVVRPTTNRPLIYRHESFPPLIGLSGPEVIHQVSALRGLAIIDFPDFDSLETAHQRLVLDNLNQLDLVLWVTDPNKYADRRLYEVMRQVNQVTSAASQAVALNKVDQLLNREDGQKALKEVLESLEEQLVKFGGWTGPEPWPISAAEGLAAPEKRSAGGLGPLRDLLEDLTDAKIRRSVELSNLEARNISLKEALKQAARPDAWLEKLQALKNLETGLNPSNVIDLDLTALNNFRPLYLAPKIDRIGKKATGLLSIFTDAWAFVTDKFKKGGDTAPPPVAPPPVSPAFVSHLTGRSEDFSFITGQPSPLKGADLARTAEVAIEKALNEKFYFVKDPRPSSWLLLLWPIVLAVLLVWAESGGQFGGPAAVTAAAVRSLAPWFIFSLIGEAVLTNFVWFRIRRRLEMDFQKALDQAKEDLLKLSQEKLGQMVEEAINHQSDSLDRLAELQPILEA